MTCAFSVEELFLVQAAPREIATLARAIRTLIMAPHSTFGTHNWDVPCFAESTFYAN
jgi:hypothetical protein